MKLELFNTILMISLMGVILFNYSYDLYQDQRELNRWIGQSEIDLAQEDFHRNAVTILQEQQGKNLYQEAFNQAILKKVLELQR